MRFIILLGLVAGTYGASTCADQDDGGGGGHGAWTLAECAADGDKLLASQAGNCATQPNGPCVATDCCEVGVATDNVSVLKGGVCPAGTTFGHDDVCAAGADSCAVGYTIAAASTTTKCAGLAKADFADANSTGHTSPSTLTVGAAGVTVTCASGHHATTGNAADYSATLDTDGATVLGNGPCIAKTHSWTGDAGAATGGAAATITFGTPITVTCPAGWTPATYDATLAADGSTVAGGPCAAKTLSWAGDTNASANGGAQTLTFGATAVTVTCNTGWESSGNTATYDATLNADGTTVDGTGPCQAKACTDATGADTWTIDCANNGGGAATGVNAACTCDCAAVDWFSMDAGTKFCTTAATQTFPGDANSDVPSGNASAVLAAAGAVTVTCSSGFFAAADSAGNGNGGAASYAIDYVAGAWTYNTAAAAFSCQAPACVHNATPGTDNWKVACANSGVISGTPGHATTPCACACAAGFGGTGCVDVVCAAGTTSVAAPHNLITCDATHGTAGGPVAAADPSTCTCTCADGWGGADCSKAACTATAGTDAAASGTVVCNATNGTPTGFDGACTCTCKNSYTGADCATAPVAASPASPASSPSASVADSAKSPAFIAGTAIAGIALLL